MVRRSRARTRGTRRRQVPAGPSPGSPGGGGGRRGCAGGVGGIPTGITRQGLIARRVLSARNVLFEKDEGPGRC